MTRIVIEIMDMGGKDDCRVYWTEDMTSTPHGRLRAQELGVAVRGLVARHPDAKEART